jgi:hypothetical protein
VRPGLLWQPAAHAQDYGEQVDDILALLRGSYRSAGGSAGESAAVESRLELSRRS